MITTTRAMGKVRLIPMECGQPINHSIWQQPEPFRRSETEAVFPNLVRRKQKASSRNPAHFSRVRDLVENRPRRAARTPCRTAPTIYQCSRLRVKCFL